MNILGIRSQRFNRLTYLLSVFFAMFVFGGIGYTADVTLASLLGFADPTGSPSGYIFIPSMIGYFIYLGLCIIKRLHDMNMHGAYSILFILGSFIPFINLFLWVYLLGTDGTNGRNDYGDRPRTIDVLGITLHRQKIGV